MRRAILSIALVGAAAGAAPVGRPPGAALAPLVGCTAIVEAQARLACFDKATAGLLASVDREEVVVMNREQTQATRRSLFGFNLPRLAIFGGGASGKKSEKESSAEPALTELEAKVASVAQSGYKRWLIVLEDGARWRTIEPLTGVVEPAAGRTVKIKRGLLGSYVMLIGPGTSAKVHREN